MKAATHRVAVPAGADSAPLDLGFAKLMAWMSVVIPVLTSALVTWAFTHLHFLGLFHVDRNSVAQTLASGILFVLTAGLSWLSAHYHILPAIAAKAYAKANGQPVIDGFSVPQILAFISPYLAVLAGTVAAWLLVHVHFLGIFHVQQGSLEQVVDALIVTLVTAGLTWAATNLHIVPLTQAEIHSRATQS